MSAEVVTITADGGRGRPVSRRLAHEQPGVLHLAVSVQILDRHGSWLLQRRASTKPLFADRWSNSCCSHPSPGEPLRDAALRSVVQELGLDVELRPVGVFTYRAVDPISGLVEHEQDHVFLGLADVSAAAPRPEHVRDLAVLPFRQALATTGSPDGAPWASAVLQLCFAALPRPAVARGHM